MISFTPKQALGFLVFIILAAILMLSALDRAEPDFALCTLASPMVFQTEPGTGFKDILQKIETEGELPFAAKVNEEAKAICSEFPQLQADWPLSVALNLEGQHSLFCWKIPNGAVLWSDTQSLEFSENSYQGRTVYSVKFDDLSSVHFAQHETFFFASFDAWQVEGALKRIEAKSGFYEKLKAKFTPIYSIPKGQYRIISVGENEQVQRLFSETENRSLPLPDWSVLTAENNRSTFVFQDKEIGLHQTFGKGDWKGEMPALELSDFSHLPIQTTAIRPNNGKTVIDDLPHFLYFFKAFNAEIAQFSTKNGDLEKEITERWAAKPLKNHPLFTVYLLHIKSRPYYAAIGAERAYVSESKDAINSTVEALTVGENLAKDNEFLAFFQHLPPMPLGGVFWKNEDEANDVHWSAWVFEKCSWASARGRIFLEKQKATQASKQPVIVWKLPLEATAATAVFNFGTSHFAVQDVVGKLYVFDEKGAVIWTRKFGDFIISEMVLTPDGNTLFCTKDKIWLLDERGNDVSLFPIQLQAEQTGNLSLERFKSEGFSFFSPCKNGDILAFDQDGRPLEGWNPAPNLEGIHWPLAHLENEEQDFLFALSKDGTLATFNRFGKEIHPRIILEESPISKPNVGYHKDGTPWAAVLGKNGLLQQFSYKNGTFFAKTKQVEGASDMVSLSDFDGQHTVFRHFLLRKGEVQRYRSEGILGGKPTKIRQVAHHIFGHETDGATPLIGFLDTSSHYFNAVDINGQFFSNARLYGETPFAVLYDEEKVPKMLMTTVGKEVWAYGR